MGHCDVINFRAYACNTENAEIIVRACEQIHLSNSLDVYTGKTDEKIYNFPTADPYLEEVKAFLAAVRSRNADLIRSPYADAAKTYRLSWNIRRASE